VLILDNTLARMKKQDNGPTTQSLTWSCWRAI
jgi:hypothetical protein